MMLLRARRPFAATLGGMETGWLVCGLAVFRFCGGDHADLGWLRIATCVSRQYFIGPARARHESIVAARPFSRQAVAACEARRRSRASRRDVWRALPLPSIALVPVASNWTTRTFTLGSAGPAK